MQIVIDIDDNLYTWLFDNGDIDAVDMLKACVAIRKGTPLPKGHGRLIDADALKTYIDDCDCCVGCEDESYGCADKCKCPDYLDEGMERIINNQPTIIEADKEVGAGMTREEAISILKTFKITGDRNHEAFDMAIKVLEQTRWIPVSERLPENKSYVLTTIHIPGRQPDTRTGWYQDGLFYNDTEDCWRATDIEMKAWMPLPEPYKAESEE